MQWSGSVWKSDNLYNLYGNLPDDAYIYDRELVHWTQFLNNLSSFEISEYTTAVYGAVESRDLVNVDEWI